MSSSHRHGAERPDLTGEHSFGDTGQLLCAVVFFAVWLLDTFVFKWTLVLGDAVPGWLRLVIAVPLLVLAGYLARASMKTVFGEVRDPPVVIRTGLFASIRHPMYLSEIIVYFGLLILSTSIAAGVVWVVSIVFLYALCRHEEKLLLDRFGDDYRRYMREVPMWFPRLWKKQR